MQYEYVQHYRGVKHDSSVHNASVPSAEAAVNGGLHPRQIDSIVAGDDDKTRASTRFFRVLLIDAVKADSTFRFVAS
jgi:hypothetical protein